jgi:hypothetical protein
VLGTWVRARAKARSAELFFGKTGREFRDDVQLTQVAGEPAALDVGRSRLLSRRFAGSEVQAPV